MYSKLSFIHCFYHNCIVGTKSESGRWRICDSERTKETAQDSYQQSTRMGKKVEAKRKRRMEKQIRGQRRQRSREWGSSARARFISIQALHFLARCLQRCGLTLCSTEGDEMQPWTEWIINVKISFSESNKLPMICLSERLVAWIRETPGSRGTLSSPP